LIFCFLICPQPLEFLTVDLLATEADT
jgi:hypothetical protein